MGAAEDRVSSIVRNFELGLRSAAAALHSPPRTHAAGLLRRRRLATALCQPRPFDGRLTDYGQIYYSNCDSGSGGYWPANAISGPQGTSKTTQALYAPSTSMLSKHVLSRLLLSMRLSALAETQVLKPGSIMRQTRVYSNADIVEYSKVSHDYNPLHLDPECARNAGFEDCLVHGMLVASLFPRIIAAQFPGAVYATQSMHFKLPIHVGEKIVGEVEVTNIRQIKNKYLVKFSTKCFKNDNLIALDGEATTILPTLSME